MKLVFLHIPKTGGTSIRHALATLFQPDEICPERFRAISRFSQEDLARYRFFSGHFTMAEVNRIPGEKYVVTILRDPKERILSLYYFWRRHTDDLIERANLRGPRVARQLSLAQFLSAETSPPRNAVKNEIACALAGGVFPGIADEYHLGTPSGRRRVGRYEVLRRALNNVTRLSAVGFLDNPTCFMRRICADLNLGGPPEIGRINTRYEMRSGFEAVVEEKITPEVSVLLDRCTDLDRIIYAFAQERREEMAPALAAERTG